MGVKNSKRGARPKCVLCMSRKTKIKNDEWACVKEVVRGWKNKFSQGPKGESNAHWLSSVAGSLMMHPGLAHVRRWIHLHNVLMVWPRRCMGRALHLMH